MKVFAVLVGLSFGTLTLSYELLPLRLGLTGFPKISGVGSSGLSPTLTTLNKVTLT